MITLLDIHLLEICNHIRIKIWIVDDKDIRDQYIIEYSVNY